METQPSRIDDSMDNITQSSKKPSSFEVSIAILFGALLSLIPAYFVYQYGNKNTAIGICMLATPILAGAGWLTGSIGALMGLLGDVLVALGLATVLKAAGPAKRIIIDAMNEENGSTAVAEDEATKNLRKLNERLEVAETDEEFEQLQAAALARKSYLVRYWIVFGISAVAGLGVAIVLRQLHMQLLMTGKSEWLSIDWATYDDEIGPFCGVAVGVLLSAFLGVLFRAYPLWVTLFSFIVGGYFGTGFCFLMRASYPDTSFLVPQLCCIVLLLGLGHLVSLHSFELPEEESESHRQLP
jgi:hypothetical protein